MSHEGYNLEYCRNCNKAALDSNPLQEKLKIALDSLNLEDKLADKFNSLLYHYRPKICLSGCPNGCSQPKIKDFGISAYNTPAITSENCVECEACIWACQENAITLISGTVKGVTIDSDLCLSCGECIGACPTGYIVSGERGWELMLGGRVGRHPRFADSIGHVTNDDQVVEWVTKILVDYLQNSDDEERLTHYLERAYLSAQSNWQV